MNAYSVTRICGYIVLTGGMLALGAAFGQVGLVLAGIVLIFCSSLLFAECWDMKKSEVADAEESSPKT